MSARTAKWWVSQTVPFVVIAALLGAAFSFELSPVGATVREPALGRRDRMYSIVRMPDRLVMAGAGGKIVTSDDDGRSWHLARSGVSSHLQALAYLGDRRLVAGGNAGTLILSDDGGTSWRTAHAAAPEDLVKVMAIAVQPGTGRPWAVAHFGALLRSDDRGENWTRVGNKEDVIWNAIAFASKEVGVVAGEFGRILRTVDGGETWAAVPSPVKSSLNAVAFADATAGVAVGTDGVVLLSSDAGASWQRIASGTSEHLYDVALDGDHWIAVGNKGALVREPVSSGAGAAMAVADLGLAWRTKVLPDGERLYLAGAVSGVVDGHRFRVFH